MKIKKNMAECPTTNYALFLGSQLGMLEMKYKRKNQNFHVKVNYQIHFNGSSPEVVFWQNWKTLLADKQCSKS